MGSDKLVWFLLFVFLLLHFGEAVRPPQPRYKGPSQRSKSSSPIDLWKFNTNYGDEDRNEEDEENVWERSGHFEGDIILPGGSDNLKNVLLNENSRWLNNTIPYHIEEDDFSEEELSVIKGALSEIASRTCVKPRPFRLGDTSWVTVRGRDTGCWSFVGRHDGGQELNLQTPGCIRHGIVVHEFFHALGAFHQQSADDRDDYVSILWENIRPGREGNFRKYQPTKVTSFGLDYDYNSVMHYSGKAFTKNGKPTIVPKDENAKIGQRKQLSEKDVDKLQAMYPCYKENDYDKRTVNYPKWTDFFT